MTFEKLKSYLYFVFGAFVRTESDGLSLYGSPPFEILPLKPRLSEFRFQLLVKAQICEKDFFHAPLLY